ncbi:hypothetical protein GBO34_00940 [Roseivirga pacifica]|nr:hypothetical protein [Roseivirga pacifica]MCO6367879.1 hypothetical protein [Roseivirga pacifica]MCO6377251.1 hypothetical protein [Roseivirga pacifica]
MKRSFLRMQTELAINPKSGGVGKQLTAQRERVKRFVKRHRINPDLASPCFTRAEKAQLRISYRTKK